MNGGAENDGSMLDRRRFMKYTFNAAGGAIAMAPGPPCLGLRGILCPDALTTHKENPLHLFPPQWK